MLAGIYYGAQYGGSTTAILINLPGASSSVVTALDGHPMARQGRAGVALATAAIGSFFADTVATFIIAFLAASLGNLALRFQAPEYFSLMLLDLIASIVLAQGSLLKALGMMVLGLLLGLIGTDVTSGSQRFTFGLPALSDGINFGVVAMGVFGGPARNRCNLEDQRQRVVFAAEISRLLPSREDWRRLVAPVLRGTAIGSLLGILPGGGPLLASFAAYAVEKRVSAHGFEALATLVLPSVRATRAKAFTA